MVKPIDITGTVIVPKPQPYHDKLKSLFIWPRRSGHRTNNY